MSNSTDKSGESQESKDFWGNERTEHYGANHDKVGESRKSKDFWGNERTEHYDTNHDKVGESRKSKDFWGNERTEHYDTNHDKVGESRKSKDFWGNERTEHYDTNHDKVGESRKSKDSWGSERIDHYGRRGADRPTDDSAESLVANTPAAANTDSSDHDSFENSIAKLVAVGLAVAAALWLFFYVVIPLVVINIATVALLMAMTRAAWRKYLMPASVVGALVLLADYNFGWSTETLVTHVSFFRSWISILLYVNVSAGLVAAYFVIRDALVASNSSAGFGTDWPRRNRILVGSLVVTGAVIFGIQSFLDSRKEHNNAAKVASATPQQATAPAVDALTPQARARSKDAGAADNRVTRQATAVAATSFPSSLAGHWTGVVSQAGFEPYAIDVSLTDSGSGRLEGTVRYPRYLCDGSWTLVSAGNGKATVEQTMRTGSCVRNARIAWRTITDSQAEISWAGLPARASLSRAVPR